MPKHPRRKRGVLAACAATMLLLTVLWGSEANEADEVPRPSTTTSIASQQSPAGVAAQPSPPKQQHHHHHPHHHRLPLSLPSASSPGQPPPNLQHQPPPAMPGRPGAQQHPNLAAAAALQASNYHHQARRMLIEGGVLASASRFPYVVAVVRPSDGAYLCVGTIIHPRVVVTAAHCCHPDVDGTPNPLVVVAPEGQLGLMAPGLGLGSNRRTQTMRVSGASFEMHHTRSYIHPRYQPGRFDFDIVMLVLPRPLARAAARLPDKGAAFPQPSSGPQAVVLGWGSTDEGKLSNALQQANVQAVDRGLCQQQFTRFGSRITDQMVCVTGRTCAGDSGGPVVWQKGTAQQDVVLGQVSFGFPRRKGQGCPVPNPSTVITNFAAPRIHTWIHKVLDQVDNSRQNSRGQGIVRGFDGRGDNSTAGEQGGGEGEGEGEGEGGQGGFYNGADEVQQLSEYDLDYQAEG